MYFCRFFSAPPDNFHRNRAAAQMFYYDLIPYLIRKSRRIDFTILRFRTILQLEGHPT